MADRSVVITGANSTLGAHIVRHLAVNTAFKITALVSPRAPKKRGHVQDGVRFLHTDLTRPFPPGVVDALRRADRVFHFAWVRGVGENEAWSANADIIHRLTDTMNPKRFCFISSTAASPNARSAYGRCKFNANELTLGTGGTVLTVGLVVDAHPAGPYRMLTDLVKRLPVALRCPDATLNVYPLQLSDIGPAIECFCRNETAPGNYRLFSKGMVFNRFMAIVESKYRLYRVPVRVYPNLLLFAASLVKWLPLLPVGIADRLLTFFYKDDRYLEMARPIPGFEFSQFD